MTKESDTVKDIMTRGVEEAIIEADLLADLKSGKKLRVKLGIDPTAPDIHLGHTVALRKMKQFQDAGHQLVLIIGDFTASIGDPSGRSELRRPLTAQEIKKYEKDYISEIGKIIDIKKTEIHHNSDWYNKLGGTFVYELASKVTVAKVLDRDDFQNRLKNDQDISMLEMLYPLLQGYDSVEVRADVELGGTDQKFNLLMGRKIQKRYGQKSQNVMTVPLIEGLDGVRKMSKSYGNYIAVSDSPESMYGKVMSVPDELIVKYLRLLTDMPTTKIDDYAKSLEDKKVNPRDVKAVLASEIVSLYHGTSATEKARAAFQKTVVNKEVPDEIPEVSVSEKEIGIIDLLLATKLVPSKTEARRLVEQGAVRIDGKAVKDRETNVKVKSGMIIQVGKRRFTKIK